MNLKTKSLLILFCILISSSIAISGEFQTTREDMVKELTKPTVRYRGLGSKKRAIKVAQKKNNKIEETVIMIDESVDIPRLRLKIEFDHNSSDLKTSSHKLLQEVGNALLSDKIIDQKIMINGHTDSDGTEQYNLKLSFDRANSVKNYIVKVFGINDDRLLIRGYGELLPLKPNTSFYNKQINRRVEFEVISNTVKTELENKTSDLR